MLKCVRVYCLTVAKRARYKDRFAADTDQSGDVGLLDCLISIKTSEEKIFLLRTMTAWCGGNLRYTHIRKKKSCVEKKGGGGEGGGAVLAY